MKFPILLNRTTLPISSKSFDFNSDLLKVPRTLKEFVHQFQHKKKIFDLQERNNNYYLDSANKNFYSNYYTVDIFLFVTPINLLVATPIVMYILCKHMKLKTLVASLAVQQVKEISMVAKQEHVSIAEDIECICKIQWHNILLRSLSVLGLVIFIFLKSRKLKLFRGHLFLSRVKIMLFM